MDNCKLCSQPVDRNLFKVIYIIKEIHYFADFEQVFAPYEGRIFININLVPSIFSLKDKIFISLIKNETAIFFFGDRK